MFLDSGVELEKPQETHVNTGRKEMNPSLELNQDPGAAG